MFVYVSIQNFMMHVQERATHMCQIQNTTESAGQSVEIKKKTYYYYNNLYKSGNGYIKIIVML